MNIKLVITDLDGTLLNDKKEINQEFWSVHQQLIKKGFIFSVASGRQLYSITNEFSNIKNETLFIAENGTIVSYKGEQLLINPLPFSDAVNFINMARQIPETGIVLCGLNSAYIENSLPQFQKEAEKYYYRLKKVSDLTEVNDTILKLAIYDFKNPEQNSYPVFESYRNRFKIAVSGQEWMDIANYTATKGAAVSKIQKHLGILPEETMVFGDYLNDLEMMAVSEYSYAMKNAHPEILKAARYVTEKNNNENGVVETLKKQLL